MPSILHIEDYFGNTEIVKHGKAAFAQKYETSTDRNLAVVVNIHLEGPCVKELVDSPNAFRNPLEEIVVFKFVGTRLT